MATSDVVWKPKVLQDKDKRQNQNDIAHNTGQEPAHRVVEMARGKRDLDDPAFGPARQVHADDDDRHRQHHPANGAYKKIHRQHITQRRRLGDVKVQERFKKLGHAASSIRFASFTSSADKSLQSWVVKTTSTRL